MAARLPGLLAGAMIAGVAVLYVSVILCQGEPHNDFAGIVVLYTALMLTAAALATGGTLAQDAYWRRLQFGIAAAITLVCGILGALSIGMFFLPPLLLLAFAVGRG